MNLNEIPVGEQVQVTAFRLNKQTALRLQALGMLPGTRISILQKKGNGTCIINLRGTRFALGSDIAREIEVAYA